MEKQLEAKVSYVTIKDDENLLFLKELYTLMQKYSIHKIYRISYNNKGEIIDAHQSVKTNIGNNHISYRIFETIKEICPKLYFNIFYRVHIMKYRKRLKKICDYYNIKSVSALSYSLYQGIYASKDKLCISGVEIAYKNGRIDSIDKLYLDI